MTSIAIDWSEWLSPVFLSLKVTFFSSLLVLLAGGFSAWCLSRRTFIGKTLLETAFLLPLALPPTVVGFMLLVLLGRKSWIGRGIEWLFQQPVVFTWGAAVIASFVVAFPLVYQTVKTGLSAIDREVFDAARSDGASEKQLLFHMTLPLLRNSLAAAYLLGFARGLGEFGATLMIAGNIPHRTQTLPTAIYIAVETGNTGMAWAWTITIVAISFAMMLAVHRFRD
ncbi:MAG: molybdenum transporter permease [Paenibacillaceae bacterium]|jgi:molybdate transport system permease protein|nr:molybdenum transporter permease [Paenibacillaceae bacterium]